MTPERRAELQAAYEIRHAAEMKQAAEVKKEGRKVEMWFESEDDALDFRAWFLDGGGDQSFDYGSKYNIVWSDKLDDGFTFLRHKEEEEEDGS